MEHQNPLWSTKTLFSEHQKSVWEQISQFIIYLQFFISGKQKTKIHMAFSLLSIKYWSDNFSYKLEKYKFPQSITADKAIKEISLPHAFCLKTSHPPTPPLITPPLQSSETAKRRTVLKMAYLALRIKGLPSFYT